MYLSPRTFANKRTPCRFLIGSLCRSPAGHSRECPGRLALSRTRCALQMTASLTTRLSGRSSNFSGKLATEAPVLHFPLSFSNTRTSRLTMRGFASRCESRRWSPNGDGGHTSRFFALRRKWCRSGFFSTRNTRTLTAVIVRRMWKELLATSPRWCGRTWCLEPRCCFLAVRSRGSISKSRTGLEVRESPCEIPSSFRMPSTKSVPGVQPRVWPGGHVVRRSRAVAGVLQHRG